MSNQGKRISKDYKKEKTRVYSFAGYLPANKNICRYLPLFTNTKNAIIRLFVLFRGFDGMKVLAYLQTESVQTSVLLVCGLLMRSKSSQAMQ